jgi:polyketide biosynthesis acyl carrier protein
MKTQAAIFDVIKTNIQSVLFDVDPQSITIDKSLTELGANSVDRVEVLMNSMEQLQLKIPRVELHGIENLRGLVEVFHRHLQERSGTGPSAPAPASGGTSITGP